MRDTYDVIAIGAGAGGLGAARRLMGGQADVVVLEASDRIGGRAQTVNAAGYPLDLGCGWLHSADQNPMVQIAQSLGLHIDRSPPPWQKQAFGALFAPGEQEAFQQAYTAFNARLHTLKDDEPDRPASDYLEPAERWSALFNAISTYYNGVELSGVSTRDFNAYIDTGVNWRVSEGYGALIGAFAAAVPVVTDCPVTRISWGGEGVRVSTPRGELKARAAIVAAPPTQLATQRLRFDPPLPEKAEAAAGLSLGVVEKVFFKVDGAENLFPKDGHLFASIDRVATGSYHLRPFGRPLIEGFFAGELARELDAAGPAAFVEFARQELTSLLGNNMRAQLAPIAQSRWLSHPYIGGAYSHALPGMSASRAALAAPVAERLFFAGEACSHDSFSTAHGAYLTGVAAAELVLHTLFGR